MKKNTSRRDLPNQGKASFPQREADQQPPRQAGWIHARVGRAMTGAMRLRKEKLKGGKI